MDILYVNPGKINAGLDFVIKGPPLALLTIAAMLPKDKYGATLYDFKVETYKEKEFRKLLRKHDVVAISCMTPQAEHALEVATMAKEEGANTIIGGYHPTLQPETVALHPDIDYVVRSEGEYTFKELIYYLDHNKDNVNIEDIKGISYKSKTGAIIHNEDRPLEMDLDKLPIPRRDLLNRTKYNYMGARVMLMETSRGCPHRCKFCCIIKMWNDPDNKVRYRTKSLKRIMQEMYSIDLNFWDFIFFSDDNFTISVKRTKKILQKIISSGINKHIMFSCQTRVDTLTNNPELVDLMKDAGVKNCFLGIESVHQQSLDKMGKKTNIDMIQKAVKLCHKQGISVFGGMIIGYPGETIKMVRENIDFAKSLELEFVQFTPITAFPGTDFYKEMEQEGKIATKNYKYYNLFSPMMRTDEISFVEMYKLVGEAYAKYYNNVWYMSSMIKRLLTDKNYRWFFPVSSRWLKQFAIGGLKMLHQNGISQDLARNEDKNYFNKMQNQWRIKLLSKRRRYKIFKQKMENLLKDIRNQGKSAMDLRSETLKQFLIKEGIEKYV